MENVVVDAQPSSSSAPVETLPPEILREIFQAMAHEECISVRFSQSCRLKCRYSLFTLLRVCSLWRNISLSQPSLWSTLSFSPTAADQCYQGVIAKNVASLREILQLSTNVTLRLEVLLSESELPLVAYSALHAFTEHAHRYRALTFRFQHFAVMNHTWEIFRSTRRSERKPGIDVDRNRLRQLESLTLEFNDPGKSPDNIGIKPFSHQCPQLHALHITILHSKTMIPSPNNLTALTVAFYIGPLAILLANHPLLRNLTIQNISIPGHTITRINLHPVHHTNLKTLIWCPFNVELDYGPRAWDFLYLPNLLGLGIDIDSPPYPEQSPEYKSDMQAFLGVDGSFEAMKAMLVRSKCTLENVSLYDIPEDVVEGFFRDVSMREGCKNGRAVYDIPSKEPTYVDSSF